MIDEAVFEANIKRLRAAFPGVEAISIVQAASFFGCDPQTLREDRSFPVRHFGSGGKRVKVPLVSFARWLSV